MKLEALKQVLQAYMLKVQTLRKLLNLVMHSNSCVFFPSTVSYMYS